ncbi:MAG: tetratricopeptide repeat protein [Armatimonadetes bacterium]|nr:tetratricopeptide repeat protein [Armatimonadota bacterium]
MSEQISNITQLFDMPGAGSGNIKGRYHDKEGKSADESREYGEVSLGEGDYEAAIRHFKKAIEQGSPESGFDLAAAYESADMLPQAFYQYERARKVVESGELFIGLSTLYRRYGRMRDAVGEMEQSIKANPKDPYLHFKLAETLRNAGFPKAALPAIQGAIALAPDDEFYHYWAGDLMLDIKDFEGAKTAVHAAAELNPGDDHFYTLAALAFWGLEKHSEAIRATRLALDLDPNNLSNVVILHQFLTLSGQNDAAKQEDKRLAKAERYDWDLAQRQLKRVGITLEIPSHIEQS